MKCNAWLQNTERERSAPRTCGWLELHIFRHSIMRAVIHGVGVFVGLVVGFFYLPTRLRFAVFLFAAYYFEVQNMLRLIAVPRSNQTSNCGGAIQCNSAVIHSE